MIRYVWLICINLNSKIKSPKLTTPKWCRQELYHKPLYHKSAPQHQQPMPVFTPLSALCSTIADFYTGDAGVTTPDQSRWLAPRQEEMVQTSYPSLGEMDKLTALTGHHREYWECCILVFTETWINFSLYICTILSSNNFLSGWIKDYSVNQVGTLLHHFGCQKSSLKDIAHILPVARMSNGTKGLFWDLQNKSWWEKQTFTKKKKNCIKVQ